MRVEGSGLWAEHSRVLALDARLSAGKLAWLYEFEQTGPRERPADGNAPAATAVDKLLASYWP